ncbi:MAG: putative Ig domain-containing protein [Planctomycetes bacterium]|nr:putative Ig domain-containing protein [Planctomycetota bacterium]
MKAIRRTALFLLSLVLMCAVAACGGDDGKGGEESSDGGGTVVLLASVFPPASGTTGSGALILQPATEGVYYTVDITVSGGAIPYNWSATGLPAGLALVPGTPTAVIGGTPTAQGIFSIGVDYGDASSASGHIDLELTVLAPPPAFAFATVSLPNGVRNIAYSQQLTVSNGVAPYSFVALGGGLPPGLILTGGPGPNAALAGTPQTIGSYNFTLVCFDSAGEYCTRSYIVEIEQDFLSFTPSAIPPATEGGVYSQQLTPKGGSGTGYNFAVTAGGLPPGMNLSSSGLLSGTPTSTGTYPFEVTLTDSAAASDVFNVSVLVYAAGTQLAIMPHDTSVYLQLPDADQMKNYSAHLYAAGGSGQGYTWSVVGGGAPIHGMTLSQGGTPSVLLSGACQYAGTFSFTLRVVDSASNVVERVIRLTVFPGAAPINITPPGSAYIVHQIASAATGYVECTGGSGQGYVWHLDSGVMPPGLTFGSPFGTFGGKRWTYSGTPSSIGIYSIVVSVTDSLNQRHTRGFQFSITAPAQITITTGSLPDGTIGTPYSQIIEAYGGVQSGFSWTISAGTLPPGLNLSPTGTPQTTLAGTPTTIGVYTFEVRVEDSAAAWTSRQWQITILPTPGTLAILTASVPDAALAAPYSAIITATGGIGSNFSWSVISGSLPPGLSLAGGTPSATLSGTPTAAGNFAFTLRVMDPSLNTDQRAFSMSVSDHTIGILYSMPAEGVVGTAYSYGFSALGGIGPNIWAVQSGSLPPGLSLSGANGLISGTPSTAGVFYSVIRVDDSNNLSSSQPVRLIVRPAAPGALTILNTTIPRSGPGSYIREPLIVSGGTPPYSWNYSGPATMQVKTAGNSATLDGGFNAGSYNFTVSVTDATSTTFNRVFAGTAVGDMHGGNEALPVAFLNTAYSTTISPQMATAPFTWTVRVNGLAPGLTFNNGTISGTPTQVGGFFIRLHIADSSNQSIEMIYVGEVKPVGATLGIQVSYAAFMKPADYGTYYQETIFPTGGTGPFIYSVRRASLPKGLAFVTTQSTYSVFLDGTPQQSGEFVVILAVEDTATGTEIERALILRVATAGPQISTGSMPAASWGSPYSSQIAAGTSASTGIQWMLESGALPPGLTMGQFGDPATLVSGNPTGTGTYNFTVRAIGPTGAQSLRALSIAIVGGPKLQFLVQPSSVAAGQAMNPAVQVEITDGAGTRLTSATNSVTLAMNANPSGSTLGGTLTVSAVAGVATFSTLSLSTAGSGNHSFTASGAGLTSGNSFSFNVLAAPVPGARLRFVSIPSTATAGQAFTTPVEVEVLDTSGVRETTFNSPVTLAIDFNAGGSTLSGTATVTATAGLATFSGLSMNRSGAGYTLRASSPGLSSGLSGPISVSHAGAAALAFVDNPRTFMSGVTYPFEVRVAVLDAFGNTVTSASDQISLSPVTGSGVSLSGTTSVAAANGIATFNSFAAHHATAAYNTHLIASATGFSDVQCENMSVQNTPQSWNAKRLRFVVEPVDVQAGAVIPDVVLELVDEGWRIDVNATNVVQLSFSYTATGPGPTAALSGTTTRTAVAGRVVFSGISVNRACGQFQLAATAQGLPTGWSSQGAISRGFNVLQGSASALQFHTNPATVKVNTPFAAVPEVQLVDSLGNHATLSSASSVTLQAETNLLGASLVGTTAATTLSGRARFDDLSLNQPAAGLWLSASAGGYATINSSTFNVIGPAVSLTIGSVTPNLAMPGDALSVTVTIRDLLGTACPDGLRFVTLSLETGPPGATLYGTTTAASTTSTVSFFSLRVSSAGAGYRLLATSSGLVPAVTPEFATRGPASKLSITSTPLSSVAATTNFSVALRVADDNGQVITSATDAVSASLVTSPAGAALGGTLLRNAAAGVVTFNDLTVSHAGLYVVRFSAPGLVPVDTPVFEAAPGGTPFRLAFVTQPTGSYAGGTFTTSVRVLSPTGTLVTSPAQSISVGLVAGPTSASLSGTTTVTTVNGLATFTGLSIDTKGTGYRLLAVSGPLKTVQSSNFSTEGAPASIALVGQPRHSVVGSTINPAAPFIAQIVDAQGFAVTKLSTSISASLTGGSGGATLTPPGPFATSAGQVILPALSVSAAGTNYQLVLSATGLTSATSDPFNVTATGGSPARLSVSNSGFGATTATAVTPAIQVAILDGLNAPVSTATNTVTASILSGPAGASLSGTLNVAAVAGVATFSNIVPSHAGTYRLRFTASGCSAAETGTFTVVQHWGAADSLQFFTQPHAAKPGANIGPVVVRVRDAAGLVVQDSTILVTVSLATNPGGATLGGTLSVNAVGGVATFTDLSVSVGGAGYSLAAAASGISGSTSSPFDVGAVGTPARLVFLTQPAAELESGATWPGVVRVKVVDALGLHVTGATNSITLALGANPGATSLSGTLTSAAVDGVATFAGLSVSVSAEGYTLTATSSGLSPAESTPFQVGVRNTARRLVFATVPATAWAGQPSYPAVTVRVTDDFGKLITAGNHTVGISLQQGGATLGGSTSGVSILGIATFADLSISAAGSWNLLANATGLEQGSSPAIVVQSGGPTQLAFVVQPGTVQAGSFLFPPPRVEFRDASGTPVADPRVITVSIATNPGGATLGGTQGVPGGPNGSAFMDLWLDIAATGYVLRAEAVGLPAAHSNAFYVTGGPAVAIVFGSQPMGGVVCESLAPAPTVVALDKFGNASSAATGSVEITWAANPADASLIGLRHYQLSDGVATISQLAVDRIGTGYSLRAAMGTTLVATSSTFLITGGAPAMLAFSALPAQAAPGASIAPALQVRVLDRNGHQASGGPVNVTLSLASGSGTLAGTLMMASTSGVATFSQVNISATGTGKRILASAAGLAPALSAPFETTATPRPVVAQCWPRMLRGGLRAVLVGSGFGATPAANTVVVDGQVATVFTAAPDVLTILVPTGITAGTVVVTVGSTSSLTFNAEYGPERINVDSAGTQSSGGATLPQLSASGRRVMLTSSASDLVANDNNLQADVFLRDRQTGATTRLSTSTAGVEGNDNSEGVFLRVDGELAHFRSYANNLAYDPLALPSGLGGYLRDIPAAETHRVALVRSSSGTGTGIGPGVPYADGRFMRTTSDNRLAFGAFSGTSQSYIAILDTWTDTVERFSPTPDGLPFTAGFTVEDMTPDGRFFLFRCSDANFVNGDTNGRIDMFVYDRTSKRCTRVSLRHDGGQSSDDVYGGKLSANGRFVAFSAWASDLVPGDTNGQNDIFVRDLHAATTTRVSLHSAGTQSSGNSQHCLGISPDGRMVLFASQAGDLVTGDLNGTWDVFAHDRATGLTTRVSVSQTGSEANQGSSFGSGSPAALLDLAAFTSASSNLVPADTNAATDAFIAPVDLSYVPAPVVLNRPSPHLYPGGIMEIFGAGFASDPLDNVVCFNGVPGTTLSASFARLLVQVPATAISGPMVVISGNACSSPVAVEFRARRVSVASGGVQAAGGDSDHPAIDAQGHVVAFASDASNLVASDTNGLRDIFVHDLRAGTTQLASAGQSGAAADGPSFNPTISADGRFVCFESDATNLVPGDTNGLRDIFVYDRVLGSMLRVNVTSGGAQGNGPSRNAQISPDGGWVAFESDADNLVTGDTNGATDVFVAWLHVQFVYERISVSTAGVEGNAGSYRPRLSFSAHEVVFESDASNLVAGDTNGSRDIFLRKRLVPSTGRVSVDSSGTQANNDCANASISADGSVVAFDSAANNLVTGDTNAERDVFVHVVATAATTRASVATGGPQGNGASSRPSLDFSGKVVAFESLATNLVAADTNGSSDVFVHQVAAAATLRVAVQMSGAQIAGGSHNACLCIAGEGVVFATDAPNLAIGDTNGLRDIVVVPARE